MEDEKEKEGKEGNERSCEEWKKGWSVRCRCCLRLRAGVVRQGHSSVVAATAKGKAGSKLRDRVLNTGASPVVASLQNWRRGYILLHPLLESLR